MCSAKRELVVCASFTNLLLAPDLVNQPGLCSANEGGRSPLNYLASYPPGQYASDLGRQHMAFPAISRCSAREARALLEQRPANAGPVSSRGTPGAPLSGRDGRLAGSLT
jgi:hypothetical protein